MIKGMSRKQNIIEEKKKTNIVDVDVEKKIKM
jgi:hypothetical protein